MVAIYRSLLSELRYKVLIVVLVSIGIDMGSSVLSSSPLLKSSIWILDE
jgi:hypothetical protein